MRKRYDNIYRRERELRIEATNYLRESRIKLFHVPQEATQPMRMALRIEEPSIREEVRQALSQAKREPTRWPDQTTQEKLWTMPPK